MLDSCRSLHNQGFKITYLPVKKDGLVDLELLEKAITPETVLVSIMMINNEIDMHCYITSSFTIIAILAECGLLLDFLDVIHEYTFAISPAHRQAPKQAW